MMTDSRLFLLGLCLLLPSFTTSQTAQCDTNMSKMVSKCSKSNRCSRFIQKTVTCRYQEFLNAIAAIETRMDVEFAAIYATTAELSANVSINADAISSLNVATQDYSTMIQSNHALINENSASIVNINTEITSLTTMTSNMNTMIQGELSRSSETESSITDVTMQLETTTEDLEKVIADQQNLTETLNTYYGEVTELITSVENLGETSENLVSQVQDLEECCNTNNVKIESLVACQENMTAKIDELCEQATASAADLETQQTATEEIMPLIDAQNETITTILIEQGTASETVQTLEDDIEVMNATMCNMETLITEQNNTINDLQAEIETLKENTTNELETKVDEMNCKIENLTCQINDMAVAESNTEELQNMQELVCNLTTKLEELESKIVCLVEEISNIEGVQDCNQEVTTRAVDSATDITTTSVDSATEETTTVVDSGTDETTTVEDSVTGVTTPVEECCCPDGFVEIQVDAEQTQPPMCIQIQTTADTFSNHQTRCEEMGSTLVESICDFALCEIQTYINTMPEFQNNTFYVGGTDEASEGTWLWQCGEPMDVNWGNNGEPDGGVEENCAALCMKEDPLHFESTCCDDMLLAICSIPADASCGGTRSVEDSAADETTTVVDSATDETTAVVYSATEETTIVVDSGTDETTTVVDSVTEVTTPFEDCPSNLVQIEVDAERTQPPMCLKFQPIADTFWNHQARCEEMNMTLAESICDFAFCEIETYVNTIAEFQNKTFYVGATDEAVEGTWLWQCGEPMEMDVNWGSNGEPDGGVEQNCAALCTDDPLQFESTCCDNMLYAICQM